MRNDSFEVKFGRHASRAVREHFERVQRLHGTKVAERSTQQALGRATFGRGPLAGRTGSPFKDDPFYNPWLKGGKLNR